MSRHRTPATVHASNVPPHHTSFGFQRQGIGRATLEAALEQIVHSFVNIDYNRFFRTFHPHSFVYRYIEKFDCDQFTENMLRAFPAPKSRVTYSAVQATKDAKIALNEELHLLICVFAQMHEARLKIGNIRATLLWVGRRNHETYIKLLKEPVPHPLDSNPLPPPPRHVHWVSQQYLEPPLSTVPSPTYYFEEVSPISVAVPHRIFHPHDQVRGHSESQRTVHVRNANVASEWDPRGGPSRLSRNTAGHEERYVDMSPRVSSSYIDTNGSRSSARSRLSHESDESHPMHRHRSASASYGRTGRFPDSGSHDRRVQEEEDENDSEDEDVPGYIPPPPYDLIFPPEPAKSRARNIIENIKTLKSYFKSR